MSEVFSVLTIGKPDRNGVIYDDEALEEMLKASKERPIFGYIGYAKQDKEYFEKLGGYEPYIQSQPSHKILNVYKTGENELMALIEPLETTTSGKRLKMLLDRKDVIFNVSPTGFGYLLENEDGTSSVSNFKLLGYNITLDVL